MPQDTPTHLVIDGHTTTLKMRVYRLATADMGFSAKEQRILRQLAGQVADLAARPVEDAKRALWYRHNALEPTRPVIFCEPEDGWREVIPPAALECEGPVARQWEMHLRKQVFWGAQMRDDYVIEPYFNVSHVFPELHWGLKERQVGGEIGGRTAVTWEAPIHSYEDDLPRLRFPEIRIDWEATNALLALADSVLGDLLTVRLRTQWWWSAGLTTRVTFLRGLERFMLDLVEQPDNVHRLMDFLTRGMLALLDYTEANGLLFLNNDGTYVGSGGLGFSRELPQPDFEAARPGRPERFDAVRAIDTWGTGESQETVGISPRMFEEFIFPYELQWLERFGLNCYGCCEPLDRRWHVIQKAPRLRRVSVSAWADWARMAELLGDRYIFSMKPTPGDLATSAFDEEKIRADLRQALRLTRNCRVEVIMKDNHTVQGDPSRLVRWVRIAREEAERL